MKTQKDNKLVQAYEDELHDRSMMKRIQFETDMGLVVEMALKDFEKKIEENDTTSLMMKNVYRDTESLKNMTLGWLSEVPETFEIIVQEPIGIEKFNDLNKEILLEAKNTGAKEVNINVFLTAKITF